MFHATPTWWCGPRPRLVWVEMAVGLPGGPSYPGHSPLLVLFADRGRFNAEVQSLALTGYLHELDYTYQSMCTMLTFF